MPDLHRPRPVSGLLESTVHTDAVLDGRYRLRSELSRKGPVVLWLGDDLVLARPVAVRVIRHLEGSPEQAKQLLDAAMAAGRLVVSGAASTYDATTLGSGDDRVTYVVTEWVEGLSLASLLEDGPLPPDRAAWMMLAAARVLEAAHARGLAHGALSASDVIVTGHGQVKVIGIEVDSAAREPSGGLRPSLETRTRLDVEGVGRIGYAALTGRWPDGDASHTLPQAPRDDAGALYTPRMVRAGIPRALDGVVLAALGSPRSADEQVGSMSDLVERLEQLPPPSSHNAGSPEMHDTQPGLLAVRAAPRRRWRRLVLPVLVVVVLALIAWLLGSVLGRLPSQRSTATQPSPRASAAPSAAASGPLRLAGVRSFDPERDGVEQPDKVHLATDGNPSTVWPTDTYYTAAFGGYKTGLGLQVDLGSARTVRAVHVLALTAGASLELRAADAEGASAGAYRVVATDADAGTSATLRSSDTHPHRYWLLWITKLPPVSGGFREDLAELTFLS